MLETKCVVDNFEMFLTVLTVIAQTTTVFRSNLHNINCGLIDVVQDMNFKNLSGKPYHIGDMTSLSRTFEWTSDSPVLSWWTVFNIHKVVSAD